MSGRIAMKAQSKIFYTSCMGAGPAEFVLVERYYGEGIYRGVRRVASDAQLELYLTQLKADNLELPSGTCFVTVMCPMVMGDLTNDDGAGIKVMLAAFEAHLELNYNKRKAVADANLCFVGRDFAGRLDKLRPMFNAFSRKVIRESLADTILKHTSGGHRYYLDRHRASMLREYSTRL